MTHKAFHNDVLKELRADAGIEMDKTLARQGYLHQQLIIMNREFKSNKDKLVMLAQHRQTLNEIMRKE